MRTTMRMSVLLAFAVLAAMPTSAQENAGKVETKQIAEEAFIYGFPLVMNYAVFYDYFIDRSAAGYKAPTCTRRRTKRSLRRTVTRLIRSSAWTFGPSRW